MDGGEAVERAQRSAGGGCAWGRGARGQIGGRGRCRLNMLAEVRRGEEMAKIRHRESMGHDAMVEMMDDK